MSENTMKDEEDAQIDFNQPILSVRNLPSEFPSKDREGRPPNVSLPLLLKSDTAKSGLVANPGTVPFVWERSPGRCKNGEEILPPEEELPGRPKLPPGSRERDSADSNETDAGRRSFESETYEDAIGSVSRSDSFFMNCSISGVSEFDTAITVTDTDAQTRDFMMGRFLPAAEAIACEKPLFSSRKPPIPRKKIVPNLAARTVSAISKEESTPVPLFAEDESDEDELDARHVSSGKACGWLPRLCLQSSFNILNPIPGLRPPRPPKRVPIRQSEENRRSKLAANAGSPYAVKRMVNREAVKRGGNKDAGDMISDSASSKGSTTSFRQLLAKERMEWESDSSSSIVEKNVCIESISFEKYCGGSDFGNDREDTETASIDSSLRDMKLVAAEEQGNNKLAIVVIHPPSETEMKKDETEVRMTNEDAFDIDRLLEVKKCAYELETESKTSAMEGRISHESVVSDGAAEVNKCSQDLGGSESCVAPPPLPKSPSESWLHRTLPNVASKTSASRMAFGNLRMPSTRHNRK